MTKLKELSIDKLRRICKAKNFKFKTTNEIKVSEKILNQQRAARAIDFGLRIKDKGYNIFAAGLLGTGRNTAVSSAIEKIASTQPAPGDWCYVYNFDHPDEPKAIHLKAGLGEEFKKDMNKIIKELKISISRAFDGKDYEERKRHIVKKFQEKRDKLVADLEQKAGSRGFKMKQTSTGLISLPLFKGKAVSPEKFESLNKEEREKIEKEREELQLEMSDAIRKIRNLEKEIKLQVEKLDKRIALFATEHLIEELKQKYKDYVDIIKHLERLEEDVIDNIDIFRGKEPLPFSIPGLALPSPQKLFTKYRVNAFVNNKEMVGAPIIKEINPTYYNLVGRVEYRSQLGSMTTDFTMMKPGAIHLANGGYLIIQALDLLKNFMAWEAIKRVIETGQVKIEDINEQFRLISTVTLKPQPIPVNVKIILVGHPLIYHLLYVLDEDFRKLFKVKADFSMLMDRTSAQVDSYVHFISITSQHEKLLSFTNQAVAKIVEYGSRLVEDQDKLSARFLDIANLLREASYWAESAKSNVVTANHVTKAIEEKIYRSDMIEERLRELIKDGSFLIDTKSKIAGQVNGISVIDVGDYAFGLPSRITARAYMGQKGLVDIQREAKLGGRIHSKGVMIIAGYFGEKFAQNKPLAVSASLSFEQTYCEIEGDSASSAEIYALMSTLSNLPIEQGIAVTGSVDQRGNIQSIGAVNEKIEGFYHVCKQGGLNGRQGVVIPESNVRNLMLKEEILKAVKDKKFHIYPIKTIEEGIEILTGKSTGIKKADGSYPKNTVFGLVDKKLTELAEGLMKFSKDTPAKNNKRKNK